MKVYAPLIFALLLMPLFLLGASDDIAEITTTAELKTLTTHGITNMTPFRIEGVITVAFTGSFVVEDETGWALIQNEKRISVTNGDVVVVHWYA